ncbi:MAG: hypothetical protein RR051_02075 [Clostridiales bacterium]
MARKRMIDPSFWTDEKLGECSMQERLLFMGLISNADDEGYGRANPKLLRSSIFAYDDLRTSDLEKWLSRLGGLNLIVLYEVEEQAYYYLPNFSKHQTINRPTKSIFPGISDAKDSVDNNLGSLPRGLSESSVSPHGVLSEDSRLKEVKRKEKEYGHLTQVKMAEQEIFDQWFPRFWAAYPRKVKKKEAQSAFGKALKNKVLPEDILFGLQRFLAWCRANNQETQYIPHASAWLNGERWNDDLTGGGHVAGSLGDGCQDLDALFRQSQVKDGGKHD